MNAVLMMIYNTAEAQLDLTKRAYESVLTQDFGPLFIVLVNNGSNEETRDWLVSLEQPDPNKLVVYHEAANRSPAAVANGIMRMVFTEGCDKIFGTSNDVILPHNCFSQMMRWPRGFICASDNGWNMPQEIEAVAVSENTPMAVMCTRKWAWEALIAKDGYFFDERFVHYCSDCDLALRMAACGIRGVQLSIPFWHYGSGSHRLSSVEVGEKQRGVADEDRKRFVEKWGFGVSSLEYGQRPSDLNFRG